ncbi:MAG: L,D-transpeptidase [Legionellales bacterium]|nr:L,D-transpeptidase [Legionellales bacterium]
MKRVGRVLVITFLSLVFQTGWAQVRFSESLCANRDYFCIKIKRNETWENLFPNDDERDIIMRVNRMNISLSPGMTLAVPKNIDRLTIYDVAPFPRYIESNGEKTIYVSQKKLAWGAYDDKGELLWWGPLSSGSGHCRSWEGNCLTPSGSFRIIRKQDIDCVSTVFPMRQDGENGGAQMPYCMHFLRGFALHGSDTVPGYRASHGCVRLFVEDARWLNEEFVDLPGIGLKGTRVIVD